MRETQRQIDAREFQEWQELYKIEPWGDDWQQAGTIAAASMASNPFSKRKYYPDSFIPKAKTRKSPQEIEAHMMQWARMHNARIEREQHGHNRPH